VTARTRPPFRLSEAAFSADETHGHHALQSHNRLLAHSDGLGWRNMYASIATEQSWSGTMDPVHHYCIGYCINQAGLISRWEDGGRGRVTAMLKPRQFGSIPAHNPSTWRLDGSPDMLHIYLRRTMVESVAEEMFGMAPDIVDLQPILGTVDPMLEQLALSVMGALKHPEDSYNGLYIDQVAVMTAAHLLRHYAARPAARAKPNVSGRAEPGLWRARDYALAHLGGDLGLDVLAREAGMSQMMFAQRFTALYEETPYKFVVSQRVERARQLLAGSDLPIAEIALQTGFCSQSHLSDVFKRMVGETPNSFRRARFASSGQA
jgi:AraC family transcriptional regulator